LNNELIDLISHLFELEDYFRQKVESDPHYKSYLDGSYYKKIYVEREEKNKKDGEVEANSEEEN